MCMGQDSSQCSPPVPVAGVEVVGRSISLYVPKLALWNEGTVDMYDPTLLQHRVGLALECRSGHGVCPAFGACISLLF